LNNAASRHSNLGCAEVSATMNPNFKIGAFLGQAAEETVFDP
jgi:hypothetical protein